MALVDVNIHLLWVITMKTRILGMLLLALALATAADGSEWTGRVVGVHDGDTLTVLQSGKGIKVRLVEIDAPESSQDFGQRSKQSLSDLCFGKEATVQDQSKDRYGRTLGRVSCAGVDANLEQVKRGMAWFYVQYGHDPAIKAAEEQAHADRIGLWAGSNPVPPWEYRHGSAKKPLAKRASIETGDTGSSCGGKRTCGQMSSCAEATHYLNDCGVTRLDRDHDGIPCESLCGR
jgi:endonuclease YncB( thermonuclease family)